MYLTYKKFWIKIMIRSIRSIDVGLKPFDMTLALRGEPVVDLHGHSVTILDHTLNVNANEPPHIVIKKQFADGLQTLSTLSSLDKCKQYLRMKPLLPEFNDDVFEGTDKAYLILRLNRHGRPFVNTHIAFADMQRDVHVPREDEILGVYRVVYDKE